MVAPPTRSHRRPDGRLPPRRQRRRRGGRRQRGDGGTSPHLCGMGGDLFALVRDGPVAALNASGRAGTGADAPRSAPRDTDDAVPPRHPRGHGARLRRRLGRAARAVRRARRSPRARPGDPPRRRRLPRQPAARRSLVGCSTTPAERTCTRSSAGDARRARSCAGRAWLGPCGPSSTTGAAAFYGGEFGGGLARCRRRLLHRRGPRPLAGRLGRRRSRRLRSASAPHDPTQLAGISHARELRGWPTVRPARRSRRPAWAHVLVEAATAAGYDRPEVLHERRRRRSPCSRRSTARRAGRPAARQAAVRRRPGRRHHVPVHRRHPRDGRVSLIQSNAAGFGSWLVEPNTGHQPAQPRHRLQPRPGHPAEYGPGRRPPHTLSPASPPRHGLRAVFGTMGGDAQPQILLQLAARLFRHGQSRRPPCTPAGGRCAARQTGFDTWTAPERTVAVVEGHAPTPGAPASPSAATTCARRRRTTAPSVTPTPS